MKNPIKILINENNYILDDLVQPQASAIQLINSIPVYPFKLTFLPAAQSNSEHVHPSPFSQCLLNSI